MDEESSALHRASEPALRTLEGVMAVTVARFEDTNRSNETNIDE